MVYHSLQTKMGSDNPKNLGNKLGRLVETPNLFNWVDLTQFMYPKLPTTTKKNEKLVNSLLRPNCGSWELKIYITSFLAPITTVLDCSLFAFLTSADSYVKLFDSYIKQQMMNNFSLVVFTQIRYFGSLIPNIFSIYKFVFLINAYM